MPKRDVFVAILDAAANRRGILLSKTEVAELVAAEGWKSISRPSADRDAAKKIHNDDINRKD